MGWLADCEERYIASIFYCRIQQGFFWWEIQSNNDSFNDNEDDGETTWWLILLEASSSSQRHSLNRTDEPWMKISSGQRVNKCRTVFLGNLVSNALFINNHHWMSKPFLSWGNISWGGTPATLWYISLHLARKSVEKIRDIRSKSPQCLNAQFDWFIITATVVFFVKAWLF